MTKGRHVREWYSINAVASGASETVEVHIFDVIGEWGWGSGISARRFISQIQEHDGKELSVLINSPGGAVTDGLAIYNYLRNRGKVKTKIIGIAASMAGVVALAGEEVTIAENGMFMLHNPSGIAVGDSKEMRREADVLDVFKASLQRTYESETGNSAKKVSDWMDKETWMSASEALDAGFVDVIDAPVQAAAHADLSRFKNFKPIEAPISDPKSKQPPMSLKTALFGGPSARETFLASAITALGVTDEQLSAAEKDGKPDFVVVALNAKIEGVTTNLTNVTAERDRLTGELKAANDKIASLTKEAASAPAKAQEILGNLGVPALPKEKTTGSSESDEDLVKTFNGLKGRERSAFYEKHEKRIKRLAMQQAASN